MTYHLPFTIISFCYTTIPSGCFYLPFYMISPCYTPVSHNTNLTYELDWPKLTLGLVTITHFAVILLASTILTYYLTEPSHSYFSGPRLGTGHSSYTNLQYPSPISPMPKPTNYNYDSILSLYVDYSFYAYKISNHSDTPLSTFDISSMSHHFPLPSSPCYVSLCYIPFRLLGSFREHPLPATLLLQTLT